MNFKIKKFAVGVLAILFLSSVTAALAFSGKAVEAEGVTMQSEGDSFILTETSYDADERFVYTATVSFSEGNAAGLVFGAQEESHYWTFNIDRAENRVKLLYFSQEDASLQATEILTDWFIGNDKMTESEKELVNPKVAAIEQVQLKIILSAESDGTYAEFYADNIKRFGVDVDINLNLLENLPDGVSYEGGAIGYNCFHAEVTFNDIYTGASDYSYYTELYRQQYHFSQYAHWNNDPNGLVYYDGYYHLFYQHHPYSNYWSDMYWGHARSKDLAHWELLPICLFPDADWGSGNGYMWSGSAMVYRYGDSEAIDALGWYPNGNGTGLLAFYTRDGGMQDQMIMSSDDGGVTWTKRKLISQTILTGENSVKTDCRDPKVFSVLSEGGKTTLWGMALTGQSMNSVWFLKSDNLLDWTYAGGFNVYAPECPEVQTITADDGSVHSVMCFSGRSYLVGDFTYDEQRGIISFLDLNGTDYADMALSEIRFQQMEYAKDSYATQCYYIDDSASAYYGKTVSVSWFSGVPNDGTTIESGALATLRKTWNGGGFTIPVEWGLVKSGEGYILSQTPVVKDSEAFEKTEIVKENEVVLSDESANILASVNTHLFELQATIDNPNGESISFRINMGEDEYTEIGWNATEGYYVDRTCTSDGGLTMANYHARYSSGILGTSGRQTFYILSDNGSVEIFCEDFTVPFYVLTFSSPYSVSAELSVTGEVRVESITVNVLSTTWRSADSQTEEAVLYLSSESLQLDRQITVEKEIMAYASSGADIVWTIESGEDVVEIEETSQGVKVRSLAAGSAVLKASCGNAEKTVNVTVVGGVFSSDFTYASAGVVSGSWLMSEEGLIGTQLSGDGFILSEEYGDDFTYTARFNLGTGAAAALVFRAAEDMSDYLIANYDNNGKVVKLWSPRGELGRATVEGIDVSDMSLSVTAKEKEIRVFVNGMEVLCVSLTDEEPMEGFFGLNVCATQAVFRVVYLSVSDYVYGGEGSLTVKGNSEQVIYAVYNRTLGNVKLSPSFYTVNGREIILSSSYFETLSVAGEYSFTVEGADGTFEFSVSVTELPRTQLQDVSLEYGCNAVIFIGNNDVSFVRLNGNALTEDEYILRNGTLTIGSSLLQTGENTVEISDGLAVKITIAQQKTSAVESPEDFDPTIMIVCLCAGGAVLLAAVLVLIVLTVRKRRANGGNN